ncbi:60s ribosomal protein l24 [Nannochloropsis gaditana]|uniref:60s ribosomal protein l24 n=1 Tax=Nannochloropsis gaditana TaxID=72520 RepID=W7TW72_9STRA|nr:60s ribosomal protein l24 [Nannochloropsis gaditana]
MVIKTDMCSFSEYRVYPGHGIRFVRRDSATLVFSTAKTKGLYNQRKKAARLVWTQGWRRLHKKIKVEEIQKRRTRRTTKFQRAIVGASLEEIKKKRAQKPERNAQREAALKEVKERAKAMKAKQAKMKPAGAAAGGSKQASKTKAAPKGRGTQR